MRFLARPRSRSRLLAIVAFALTLGAAPLAKAADVLTHHNDVFRTGLNNQETQLTPATVGSANFKLLKTVALADEQIDAQPLVVSAATIKAKWPQVASKYPNDVVIVATELNNIYEIDGVTGAILASANFGTAVSMSQLPGKCSNNYTHVGINGTPVIDIDNAVLYAVTYTWENGAPVHRVHEINLIDLGDAIPSVVVSASQTLSDGATVTFQAASQRQRPGLLLNNGVIYAAFGSFCDFNANVSRGWLMGWNAGSLTRLATTGLANRETAAQDPTSFYLSSIWMSGYGPSADSGGNIYVVTGNSNGVDQNNLPESAVKVAPGIGGLVDYFTPANFATLDLHDEDFGSGGIMVVPDQPNGLQVAVAAGKDGRMFLLNRNGMGGYVAGGPDVPKSVNLNGGCWCGPGYFLGGDGKPRVVSSGGTRPQTWLLPATATGALTLEAAGTPMPAGQDPGFQISISSNGALANSAIIWATSRSVGGVIYLEAYNATASNGVLTPLFAPTAMPAGAWKSPGNNANIVPTVTDGRVYVATVGTLSIFGLSP